jgi:ketosteroid isomerase-like protein
MMAMAIFWRVLVSAWLVSLGTAVGCGPPPAPANGRRTASVESIEPEEAEKNAIGLVSELAQALSAGNTDGLLTLLMDNVFAFGPGVADVQRSRSDVVLAASKLIRDRRGDSKLRVALGKPVVGVDATGHSAWVIVNVTMENVSYIVTALVVEQNSLWRLAGLYAAQSVPMKKLRKAQKAGTLAVPLQKVPSNLGASTAVDQIPSLFTKGLGDGALWQADLAVSTDVDDAIFIGPSTEQIARGEKSMKKFWKKRKDAGVGLAMKGAPVTGVLSNGGLAWATAIVEQTEDTDEPVQLRLFAVYVVDKKQAAGWRLAAVQQSVALLPTKP